MPLNKISFKIPLKPLSWNRFYGGMHWSARQRLSEDWKWAVKAALLKTGVSHETIKEPVDIEVVAYMKRLIDPDNICLKVIIDSVKHWGLLKDDSPQYVKSVKISVLKSQNEYIDVSLS